MYNNSDPLFVRSAGMNFTDAKPVAEVWVLSRQVATEPGRAAISRKPQMLNSILQNPVSF